ncbi:hypothetical protein EJ07DRAFT_156465 [Lizonia empirigonia]|nr:hypothetical protein EJ07DRAFT_156465 [Lizonia empirigonia]
MHEDKSQQSPSNELYPPYMRQEGSEGTDGPAVQHTTGTYMQPHQNHPNAQPFYATMHPAVKTRLRPEDAVPSPSCCSYEACARRWEHHQALLAMSGCQSAARFDPSQAYARNQLPGTDQGSTQPWIEPTASPYGHSASHYFSLNQHAQQQQQQMQPCGATGLDAGHVIVIVQLGSPSFRPPPHSSTLTQPGLVPPSVVSMPEHTRSSGVKVALSCEEKGEPHSLFSELTQR